MSLSASYQDRRIEAKFPPKTYTQTTFLLVGAPVGMLFLMGLSVALLLTGASCLLAAGKRTLLGPHEEWTPWFAWRPVRCSGTGKLLWMKKVLRRGVYGEPGDIFSFERAEYESND